MKTGLDLSAKGETSESCKRSASNDAASITISMLVVIQSFLSLSSKNYRIRGNPTENPRKAEEGIEFRDSNAVWGRNPRSPWELEDR